MKLSVKSDYAARALLALARHYPGGRARKADELATQYGIPHNYLVQILIELRSQRLVRSIRGKEGGYILARPPGEVSLGDVLRCVHGEVFDTPALRDPECPTELRRAWQNLRETLEAAADKIDFQQLSEEEGGKAKMYYI